MTFYCLFLLQLIIGGNPAVKTHVQPEEGTVKTTLLTSSVPSQHPNTFSTPIRGYQKKSGRKFGLKPAAVHIQHSKSPKIIVDKEFHDFGKIRQGDEVEATFIISNAGKDDLTIHSVRSGCGCATFNDLCGVKIPPGESRTLKVYLSTRNYALDLKKSITIYSDDPETQAKKIHIKAYIHVDYLLKGPIPKFENVRKGMVLTRRVPVQSFMQKPLKLFNFKSPYDYISCKFSKGDKDQEYHIEVTVNAKEAQLPTEPVIGRITFNANSDQLPKKTLSFTLTPIKAIKVEPANVFLYRFSSSKNEEVLVTLTHLESKPFTIREVVSEVPCLKFTTTQVAPNKNRVLVRIKKDAEPGRYRTKLTLKLNCEDQNLVEVPMMVIIRA